MSLRRKLLAAVREGNYAHAGEEEAIEIAMKSIPKNSNQTLLDLGCGLGGTADYIQKRHWGKVSGIDIDPAMISFIETHYSSIQAFCGDVVDTVDFFPNSKFDIFYSFNAFYCFPKQKEILHSLTKISNNDAKLIIFDYSASEDFNGPTIFVGPTEQTFSPLKKSGISDLLESSGWMLHSFTDLTIEYKKWYLNLVKRMEDKKISLCQTFGNNTFDDLMASYENLLRFMDEGKIGGSLLIAELKK